eukprot:gene24944-10598_t
MPDSLPISGWVVLILQLLCAITLPVLGWGATVGNLQEEMNAALAVADSSDADFVQLILQQGFFEAFGGIALPAAWDQKWSAVNESTAIDFSIFEGDAPESPSRILLGTNSKLHIDGISLLGLSPSTQSQAASEQGQGDISEDLLHLLSAAFYLGNSNSALWLSNVDVEVAEGSGCELLRSIQTTACDALAMGQFQSGPGFVYLENYTVTATKSQLQAVQLTGVNISCPSDPLLLFQLDNPMSAFNTSYIWDYPQQVTDALPTTPLLQCAVAMVIDYAQLKEKAENLQRFSMRVFITIRSDIHFPSSESHSGLPPIYVHRNVKIMGVPRDDSWRLNSTFLSDASSPWAAAEAIELDLGNNLNVWNVDMNTGILELHNMTVVGLALGSDELYPMSMLVGAMWAANFDRPKATRNMLLFVNCILIVPPDLYSYLAYWSAAQDPRVPQVKLKADCWFKNECSALDGPIMGQQQNKNTDSHVPQMELQADCWFKNECSTQDDSRVPQVKLTAEWFRLYIFFYIDINRADSHNIYMNERRGSGTQWINTTLSNKIRRTSPFLTSTGIQAISSVDPYLPLDQLRTVGNASELVQVLGAELAGISRIIIMNNMSLRDALKNGTLVQVLEAELAGISHIIIMNNMSLRDALKNGTVAAHGVLASLQTRPVTIAGRPMLHTTLDLGGMSNAISIQQPSQLTLQRLTLTGLGPASDSNTYAVSTELQNVTSALWSFEFLRSQSLLTLRNITLLLPTREENRSLCLAVNASTKCINYYVLGLAGIKGGGIFMVDSLSAGAYIATPPQENLQLGLTAPAGPTDTAPEPEGGSSNLSLAAIALIAVACVVGGSLVVIGTFFYMRTSKHRAAMREAAMNSKAALQHEAQTCSAISITIEKQYNSSGLNAAPGPGSIHKQYTSSDTTAAPGSGSIQKQYNSSDTTAAPGPGSIHKQYTSCGTTAAPGSGSIHKQYTSSDTTAAPGPGSIQKQYTSSGVTAISGPGSIQSTKYSDHLVSGQVTSVASARGSVEHGLPVTAMLFKGSSSGILPQFQRTLPSSVLALSSSSDGLFPLFGSEPLNSEHARQALAASVRDRPREGGEASGTPPSGHSTVEMSALHHRASMVSEASSSSERDSSPNVVLLPLSVTQISSQQTSGGSTLASFAESSGSNALASYVESQDEGSVWEAPSGDRLMGPMGAFAQARTSNSGGLPVLDRVSPPFQVGRTPPLLK